jgi:anaerobic selenocysteine-containing dehydrogenase
MSDKKEVLTRRQFLKRNILLALALAFLGYPLKAFGRTFRREPNVSDKEARFYSRLAG